MTEPTATIQPALTPEDWRFFFERQGRVVDFDDQNGGHTADPPERLYTAATCLYGQPFGFTWEDVDVINGAAELIEEELGRFDYGKHPLRPIADRIAALLPPREQ